CIQSQEAIVCVGLTFFYSSRRRHTRSKRDWSSDVCSSDLMYPNEPIDLGDAVTPLPDDHTIPGLEDWEWIHTPGHSPGHVSFYRGSDALLLSGDAFITVRQDSFYNVLMQTDEVNGPPRYLTTDWEAAKKSVAKLEALKPDMVIPGHGTAMQGEDLTEGLQELVQTFDQTAKPDYGRYIEDGEQTH